MRVVYLAGKWVANTMWKLTGGAIFALLWLVLGIVLSLSVVFLPVGMKCFRLAYFAFKPFGREVILQPSDNLILSIIWGASIGFVMTIISLFWLVALIMSIVGIPFVYQWFKVFKVSILPFGAIIM